MTRFKHRSRLEARALRHMRQARDEFEWPTEAMICDYATAALEAEGHDTDLAADAVRKVWQDEFTTQPPI